jgi:hypothetical protein
MLAACGQPETPPVAASAESIEQAVGNAERELAAAKASRGQTGGAGQSGA